MIVNLREAPAVLATVARWQFEQWGWMSPGETLQHRLQQLQGHLGNAALPTTLVAFHNDFLAGMVSLVAHDMVEYPGLSPWLSSLYVAPGYRGKGIGGRLVRQAERTAFELGYDHLFLNTENALSYFLDLDWEAIHTRQRAGGQVVVMQRNLADEASADASPAALASGDAPPTNGQ